MTCSVSLACVLTYVVSLSTARVYARDAPRPRRRCYVRGCKPRIGQTCMGVRRHVVPLLHSQGALGHMPPKKVTVLCGFQVDLESDVPVPEQIMASLQKNQVRVMDLFREWDEDGNGLITKKEFCHAMPRLGIVAPSREFELLFDTFDPDGSGAIDMKELQKGLRRKPAQDPAKETKNAAASQTKNKKTLQEQMLADLKKILQKKMLVLQKLFKEWDEDGNTAWLAKSPPLAVPQLSSCASAGRAWRLSLGLPALPAEGSSHK